MNNPLTREEDSDTLLIFHTVFHKAVTKHQAGRLELFYQLQFFDPESEFDTETQIFKRMDIISAIEEVSTEIISEHPLFKQISARQRELFSLTKTALSAASEGNLDSTLFHRLTNSMQRFDIAINRFNMGITASITDVDALTGLLNRVAMERDLDREIAQSRRTGQSFCLAMVDADHFKAVNDNYGHNFGDTVLEVLADRFEASLRPRDRIYRYGGEEFLVLLPETNSNQAINIMERLRQRSSEQTIRQDDIVITQTVSIGLAEVHSDEDIESAIKRADAALYQAKESGRNRVIVAPETT